MSPLWDQWSSLLLLLLSSLRPTLVSPVLPSVLCSVDICGSHFCTLTCYICYIESSHYKCFVSVFWATSQVSLLQLCFFFLKTSYFYSPNLHTNVYFFIWIGKTLILCLNYQILCKVVSHIVVIQSCLKWIWKVVVWLKIKVFSRKTILKYLSFGLFNLSTFQILYLLTFTWVNEMSSLTFTREFYTEVSVLLLKCRTWILFPAVLAANNNDERNHLQPNVQTNTLALQSGTVVFGVFV